MNKVRFILVACFCVVLAGGIVAGMAIERHRMMPPPPRPRQGWIERELDLTPEQGKKMREIWSDVLTSWRDQERQRREALQQERDQAIHDLFTEQQLARYEQILQTYHENTAALAAKRKEIFEHAVEQTKNMLTPEQREKYEEMLKQRAGWSRHHRRSGMGAPEPDKQKPPHRGE